MSELKGTNWEVIPHLIRPEQAAAAYSCFLALKPEGLRPPYVSLVFGRYRRRGLGEKPPVTILELILRDIPERNRQSLQPILSVFDELRSKYGHPGRNADHDRLFLDSFPPGSSTGEHKDDLLDHTIAVGLAGCAELHIQDPATHQQQPIIDLQPTTGFVLNNVNDSAMKPTHEVVNNGDVPRVSLVVQA
jgi:hypothetical protein